MRVVELLSKISCCPEFAPFLLKKNVVYSMANYLTSGEVEMRSMSFKVLHNLGRRASSDHVMGNSFIGFPLGDSTETQLNVLFLHGLLGKARGPNRIFCQILII